MPSIKNSRRFALVFLAILAVFLLGGAAAALLFDEEPPTCGAVELPESRRLIDARCAGSVSAPERSGQVAQ